MADILQQIDVHVRCVRCDETYDVSAADIAESHRLLDRGCPGSHHECMPSFLATLADASALDSLTQAWRELERSGRSPLERASLRRPARIVRQLQPEALRVRRAERASMTPREAALFRWEDDGGAPGARV